MKNVALTEATLLQDRIEKLDAEIKVVSEQPTTADDRLVAIYDTLRRAHEVLGKDVNQAGTDMRMNTDKKAREQAEQIAALRARREILANARGTMLANVRY